MTRRKLIWAIVAAVVFFTVGFFLSGEARADAKMSGTEAPAATGHEVMAAVHVSGDDHTETSVPDPGSTTGDYGFLLIVGAVLGVIHWQAGRHIWRSLRNARRVVDKAGEAVRRDADAGRPTVRRAPGATSAHYSRRQDPSYDAVADFDANVDHGIAERLQRKAAYEQHVADAMAVANGTDSALNELLAWAAEQDGQLCEELWAMDEAEEPETRR